MTDSVTDLHHQLARAYASTGIAQTAAVFMALSNLVTGLGEAPVWLTVLWAVMVPAWAFVAVWSFRTARTHRHVARTRMMRAQSEKWTNPNNEGDR